MAKHDLHGWMVAWRRGGCHATGHQEFGGGRDRLVKRKWGPLGWSWPPYSTWWQVTSTSGMGTYSGIWSSQLTWDCTRSMPWCVEAFQRIGTNHRGKTSGLEMTPEWRPVFPCPGLSSFPLCGKSALWIGSQNMKGRIAKCLYYGLSWDYWVPLTVCLEMRLWTLRSLITDVKLAVLYSVTV